MPRRTTHHRHVLITLQNIGRGFGRAVADGVLAYAQANPGWRFHFTGEVQRADDVLRRFPQIDGIISDTGTPAFNRHLFRTRKPAVIVGDYEHPIRRARVKFDDLAVGEMAAEHFAELGLRHVTFYGPSEPAFSRDRRQGLERAAAKARITFVPPPDTDLLDAHHRRLWSAMPRPCGVLAVSDRFAHRFASACLNWQIRVPEDFAVLGVDDDKYLCNFSYPPLSSIDQGAREMGYRAAELLRQLMAGQAPPPSPILIRPVGVSVRQSTEMLAVDDPDVAAALRYIAKHACERIAVSDVLRHVPRPRRTLELAFRNSLGRGIYQQIRRVQVERAKQLLRDTRKSRAQIAAACGFSAPTKLSDVFRRTTGMTCQQYRAAHHRP